MQNNIEQKLNGFKSNIFESIEKKLASDQAKIDAETSAELKAKGDILKDNAEDFRKKRLSETSENVKQMLSDAKLQKNAEALKIRKNMLESTTEALYQKAKDYAGTDAYKNRIKASIDKISEELNRVNTLTLALNKQDEEWVLPYIKRYVSGDIKLVALKKRDIGGIIISLDDAHIRYNMTLKRTIDDKKEDIGAVLYTLLEKMEV